MGDGKNQSEPCLTYFIYSCIVNPPNFCICVPQKGRQTDKAGRQLQAFIDLEELEKNREETRKMKESSANQKKNYTEWQKQNGGKKDDKKRKAAAWLYED